MDYIDWFYGRLSSLRIQKGVSARDMSLSLGQSESYINKIENRHTLPSMAGFIYICEYLEISPRDFFDVDSDSPQKSREFLEEFEKLSSVQAMHIIEIMKDLNEKRG